MGALTAAVAMGIAGLYLVLGPIVIPKLLKTSEQAVTRAATLGLRSFFVACAFTHATIAYLAAANEMGDARMRHHLLIGLPQVVGGLVFLAVRNPGDPPNGVG